MDKPIFHLGDHEMSSRLAKLSHSQLVALESAISKQIEIEATQNGPDALKRDWPVFLLPLAEFGLTDIQMLRLAEKVPKGFVIDHREIYFDFRLDRWIKHIEPPTLFECLEEYLASAESQADGMVYLEKEWQAFLHRHDKA
jgi:hypothetical protein